LGAKLTEGDSALNTLHVCNKSDLPKRPLPNLNQQPTQECPYKPNYPNNPTTIPPPASPSSPHPIPIPIPIPNRHPTAIRRHNLIHHFIIIPPLIIPPLIIPPLIIPPLTIPPLTPRRDRGAGVQVRWGRIAGCCCLCPLGGGGRRGGGGYG